MKGKYITTQVLLACLSTKVNAAANGFANAGTNNFLKAGFDLHTEKNQSIFSLSQKSVA